MSFTGTIPPIEVQRGVSRFPANPQTKLGIRGVVKRDLQRHNEAVAARYNEVRIEAFAPINATSDDELIQAGLDIGIDLRPEAAELEWVEASSHPSYAH